MYLEISGTDEFDNLVKTLRFLKETNRKACLVARVYSNTVTELPEYYELAQIHDIPLLLYYNQSEFMTVSSNEYLNRYHDVSNVYLYKQKLVNENICRGIPFPAIESLTQLTKNYSHYKLNQLRQLLKL